MQMSGAPIESAQSVLSPDPTTFPTLPIEPILQHVEQTFPDYSLVMLKLYTPLQGTRRLPRSIREFCELGV